MPFQRKGKVLHPPIQRLRAVSPVERTSMDCGRQGMPGNGHASRVWQGGREKPRETTGTVIVADERSFFDERGIAVTRT
ncbi:hypothetical protein SDC9_43475 [bioreactor metagenome]|uniref:Uncharacterized protein n=1 Tax=bioreactor metagenome TaxID=1076179 RepID=A0A644W199_9ZZZZ